ncbi:hypothetical protein [Lactococcus lactis]|uniref:hypothetical protein n=4 Tax=Lactococcus lactis TaxID=1358 RepID=UPI000200D293|nr:hypothetical protein [Lactococcus lactis]ADZ64752.1 phage protein [Lactococcus lactis subsp. lactis CV56]QQB10745.1 hypothetical protein I6I21_07095 [Lactococcus lactis]RQE16051.1 hypothetical protein D6114_12335 [Lactococcus lactis]RQE24117.1 hypothetical protein D6119_12310 [Lactococcus lactis]
MSNKKCPNCGYELDSWNDCVSVNNILECPECEEHFELKAVRLNKPQLTIPKSIADELDDIFNEFVRIKNSRSIWGLLWRAEEIDEETRMRLVWLLPDENQVNIAIAYLTGKALGVDLVKVVEA